MMAKESVKRRLEGDDGISFTEFSYQLLQAYDFLVLHDRDRLQAADSAAATSGATSPPASIWSAGCAARRSHGLVWPLLTTASGAKFGKTEGGAVWLDAARTSPYRFYQFWLNTDDRDVVQHLKWFTFLASARDRGDRGRPRRGARERARRSARWPQAITRLVHGEGELGAGRAGLAGACSAGELADAAPEDILTVFDDVPSIDLPRAALDGDGLAGADAAVQVGADRLEGGGDPADQAGRPLCERPAAVRRRPVASRRDDLIGGGCGASQGAAGPPGHPGRWAELLDLRVELPAVETAQYCALRSFDRPFGSLDSVTRRDR